jgi:hypothetical protein
LKIKIDEDLPVAVAVKLREKGYEATTVTEEALGGAKDPELWEVVQQEQKFLVTADKGFADIRRYPPGTHAGVLLLRPNLDGIRPLVELVEHVLGRFDLRELGGTLAVATPTGVRLRRRNRL